MNLAQMFTTVATPLQAVMMDRSLCITHQFCNDQAINLLKDSGRDEDAFMLAAFYEPLQYGVVWADQGWKNISHFLNPCTRRGLWRFPSAAHGYIHYFKLALKNMRRGSMGTAVFYLGAAAHLVQDMCVPHHAAGVLFDGHKRYELWVEEHLKECVRWRPSIAGTGETPYARLFSNAAAAVKLYPYVREEASESDYWQATEILLPLAQQSTASLFIHFAAQLKQAGYCHTIKNFTTLSA